MRIESFGCSFTFGTDLPDDGRTKPWPTASKMTWPALVAKKLNWDYRCFAKGGAGNLLILDRFLWHIEQDPTAFYIINWTWSNRFDYSDINGSHFVTHARNDYQSINPMTDNEQSQFYYKHFHSDFKDRLTSLIYVKTALDALQRYNCPFVMTYMDRLLVGREGVINSSITDLQKQVVPHLKDFDGKTFLEWTQHHGFPISSTSHPLTEAHEAAVDVIWPEIETQLKNHNLV